MRGLLFMLFLSNEIKAATLCLSLTHISITIDREHMNSRSKKKTIHFHGTTRTKSDYLWGRFPALTLQWGNAATDGCYQRTLQTTSQGGQQTKDLCCSVLLQRKWWLVTLTVSKTSQGAVVVSVLPCLSPGKDMPLALLSWDFPHTNPSMVNAMHFF